jgi:hypothetical protein
VAEWQAKPVFGLEAHNLLWHNPTVPNQHPIRTRTSAATRLFIAAGMALLFLTASASETPPGVTAKFPLPLASYSHAPEASIWQILKDRVVAEPFNLVASGIFLLAIIHTFLAPVFLRLSQEFKEKHQRRLASGEWTLTAARKKNEVSFLAEIFHFLGEIEAIFGIWVVPLILAIAISKGWQTARDYLGHGLDFTEPLFVVVIMTISASRPVLQLAEKFMGMLAGFGGRTPAANWLSVLTVGPLLGSFITEPAAMTICALLLAKQFYPLGPSPRFAYATLGLLFVNISIGGTLTHFAAPPVLMVAAKWGWGLSHMLENFGWKAIVGIVVANTAYGFWFRPELRQLANGQKSRGAGNLPGDTPVEPIPFWVTTVHVLFLAWTVLNAHFPALFIGGFLFYLAFLQATEHHQNELALRPALLVGFFLAGLVVHGGLQGWWIGPLLGRLSEVPLFFGATGLTAVNDNAAITYLASQVPNLDARLQYAVVAGAVVGGGLTVIANAPNPAGQSILSRFFPDGISALRLFLGALVPTLIAVVAFLSFR